MILWGLGWQFFKINILALKKLEINFLDYTSLFSYYIHFPNSVHILQTVVGNKFSDAQNIKNKYSDPIKSPSESNGCPLSCINVRVYCGGTEGTTLYLSVSLVISISRTFYAVVHLYFFLSTGLHVPFFFTFQLLVTTTCYFETSRVYLIAYLPLLETFGDIRKYLSILI